MLLIDQRTETALVRTLETLRHAADSMRCIYWRLSKTKNPSELGQKLVDYAKRKLSQDSTRLYLCEDGDIFILAPELSTREAHMFMLDSLSLMGFPYDSDIALLTENNSQTNKLLSIVDTKLQHIAALKLEAERQRKQEEQLKKREAILSAPIYSSSPQQFCQQRENRQQPVVMIVEDDAFTRRLIESVLPKDYSFISLGDAKTMISQYAKSAPDIVFLDINLPDVTGHDLLERITAIDPMSYVIMLSGNADRGNIEKALQIGAKGFIGKPFTRDKLVQYLERCPTLRQKPTVH